MIDFLTLPHKVLFWYFVAGAIAAFISAMSSKEPELRTIDNVRSQRIVQMTIRILWVTLLLWGAQ